MSKKKNKHLPEWFDDAINHIDEHPEDLEIVLMAVYAKGLVTAMKALRGE